MRTSANLIISNNLKNITMDYQKEIKVIFTNPQRLYANINTFNV
jgi:hypothetical protein